MTTAELLAQHRAATIARCAATIAGEREFLARGEARTIRTLRLMSYRAIRRAQRDLARIANDIISGN